MSPPADRPLPLSPLGLLLGCGKHLAQSDHLVEMDQHAGLVPCGDGRPGEASWGTPSPRSKATRHTAAPVNAPITIPGPKIPPDPPEPIEKAVAAMRAAGATSTIQSGTVSRDGSMARWTQP